MQFGVIIPDNSQKIIKTNFIRIDTKKDVYFLATERRQDYTDKAFEIKGFLGAVEVIKEGQAEGVKSQKGVIGQVCIAVLPIEYQRHHKSPGETVYCIGDDIF